MRFAAPLLAGLFLFAAACERNASPPDQETEESSLVTAPISDELPGLPAPATGIAFWDHPRLAFNGLMIVATEAGVLSYSMEDGTEVSRIDGFNAEGVAASYLGLGAPAAGFVAFLDGDENTFRFYGVDNQSRAFLPLDAGPAIRGAVRGFCLGRGQGVAAPSLFVIQKDKIQVFNLAASDSGVAVESQTELSAPDNLVSCAVDLEGALLVAADDGDIYRLAGGDSFSAPFAQAAAQQPGGLSVVPSASEDGPATVTGLIFLAGLANGEVHVFDSETGKALGVVRLEGTSSLPAVGKAEAFGATGANLGAVYRNGVIAFGVAEAQDGPAVRIAPASTVRNALSLPADQAVSPRGAAAAAASEGLIIPTDLDPR